MESPKNLKAWKIVYWITTSIYFLFDGLMPLFFMNDEMAKQGSAAIGVPEWLRLEASYGKVLGGFLLILPFVPPRYKEWAYVGYGISLISAFTAHVYMGHPFSQGPLMAIIVFAVLLTSYISYHKIRAAKGYSYLQNADSFNAN